MKHNGHLEIEMKFRIPALEPLRLRLEACGFVPVHPQGEEVTRLWDRDGSLAASGCALRLRRYAGRSVLTWKGPRREDPLMKIRSELETVVEDSAAMEGILAALGFEPGAPMVKSRSVWRQGDLEACLDDTPFGSFLELEGAREAIAAAMAGLAYWHFSSPPVHGQAKLTTALAWGFLKRHRLDDLGRRTVLDDLWGRIILIPAHAMRSFVDEINVPACKGLFLIMVAYVLVGLFSWPAANQPPEGRYLRRRRMRLAGFISFLGALAAYLALPHHLQEMELMTFFPRFSVLVLLMFLLLVPAGLLRLRGGFALLLPVPALVFGTLYGRQLYLHYRAYGAEVAGFVEVVEKTPPGGKALGLVFDRRSQVMQVESALLGLPGFYPAMRPALGSMVPPAYCGLRHMPCRLKVAPDPTLSPWLPGSFAPAKMLPVFDYYFVRSLPPGFVAFRNTTASRISREDRPATRPLRSRPGRSPGRSARRGGDGAGAPCSGAASAQRRPGSPPKRQPEMARTDLRLAEGIYSGWKPLGFACSRRLDNLQPVMQSPPLAR